MKYAGICLLLAAGVLPAQDEGRVAVPLTDPSRPARVQVELMHGDIAVQSHTGKDVVVEQRGGGRNSGRPNRREVDGLKRIDIGGAGLDIEERDNVVRINSGIRPAGGVTVLVPQNTSVNVKTMTGTVLIDGVRGEVEANSHNGQVKILNTEGAVVAHSLNGSVVVQLNRVDQKPMSFSTMNGDIDVTLPTDIKANLKLRNDHGEVWSDFEMKLQSTPRVESDRREDGRYRVKFERTVTGSVNGGGPELSFTTLNGQIRIRQKK